MSTPKSIDKLLTTDELSWVLLSELLTLLPEEDEEKIRASVEENIPTGNFAVAFVTWNNFPRCLNHRVEEFSLEAQKVFQKLEAAHGRWFLVRIDIS